MKKLLATLVALILLVAGGYAASTWYFGQQVEAALLEPYKALEGNPYVKLVKRDYQRGVFTSTESVTIEIFGDISRMTGGSPMLMTVNSTITHGPMPGMSQMAAAVVDAEAFISGGGLPASDRPVIRVHTMIGYDGSGEARGTVLPIAMAFPENMPGMLTRFTLSGGEFHMQFSPNMTEYTAQGSIPKLQMDMADGGQIVMSGIRVNENSKVVFPEEPALRGGTQRLAIDQVQIRVPVSGAMPVVVNRITYDTNAPVNGEFMDVTARMQITDVLVGEQNYGPAHLDISGRKLHARSLLKMQKAMAGIQGLNGSQPGANPMVALQPVITAMTDVLRQDAEVSIDRFSFNTPGGEVLVTAKIRFPGVTPEDAQSFAMLAQKMVAAAELALPEALLMMPFGPTAASPEMAAAQQQGRHQQIAHLVQQGYIYRDGTLMRAKLEFSNGRMAINGMPFDPMALQGRPMQAGPAMPPPGRPQMLPDAPVRR